MGENKLDKLKNRLPLTLAVWVIYYFLSFVMDRNYLMFFMQGYNWKEYASDFIYSLAISLVFVELSVFYSRQLCKHIPIFRNYYQNLFIQTLLLLLLNNLTAYVVTMLVNVLFEEAVPFSHQSLYIFSVLATFVSSVYINACYIEWFVRTEEQKESLEINLLKERERTAQMRLEVLKSQIDPHFMFNNFSILSELIVEDSSLAEQFLENLSRVYRYVVQNLKRDIVPVYEEISFLKSYIYLIKIRYEDAIRIEVDEALKQVEGQMPPLCLQLLVENAIKHNQFSLQQPLDIQVYKDEDEIVVKDNLCPMLSDLSSTGIGQSNIFGRYSLLCKKTPVIEVRDNVYMVKLPILGNLYENTDY